ncbi:hypothetical protein D9757_006167 [Collybiopsis confluens]|uniref:Terpene cyclase/mutase family member n=1 Tax=Collybiopsis confluens TaxID=2823264 RepID=A0A8H5HHP4_9AGAR|nr:hypothetical protein D9757_006167 [Collybiopsis confluens]
MYNPISVPESGKEPFTDYSRWRLLVSKNGRHTWHYLNSDSQLEEWPQNTVDKFWLGLPTDLPKLSPAKDAFEASKNGYAFYKHLQAHDGHWPGEYGGPMFLLPGLVIGSYVSGMGFKDEERREMIRYLINRAHPDDGGWGIHVEGHSTVFGTALNYAALRILGVAADHPVCTRARATLHKLGGACAIPSWGKFWLSILNVYDWSGNNPVPPELFLLPTQLPFHPHRWWIHTRNVYIPMSYLYAIRFKAPENELILALREELYPQNFYSINWPEQRNNVAEADLYAPHSSVLDTLNAILSYYELCSIPPVRKLALQKVYDLIVMEDENTGYQTLGPVSKMFNLIARVHHEGRESEAFKLHEAKRADFMWLGIEGMMMCGTNGSQLWDLGFITQAVVETGLAEMEENLSGLIKALDWLEKGQMLENPKHFELAFRHRTKGAWGFSTKEQGYTSKSFSSVPKVISKERMCWAVDTMLSLQNPNGGFASYELVRGPQWLEWLNPAEVFGDIMIEFCYPECTTSVITSLSIFRKYHPDYRSKDIGTTFDAPSTTSIKLKNLKVAGSVRGAFVLRENYSNSEYSKRACEFLLGKQKADGGWGESYKSCELAAWVEHKDSQVVQTCWAAMALMYAGYPEPEPLEKAVKLVMDRQLPDGSWPQEAIEGIFNKNCAIAYPNFKFSFPIWMLGKAHWYLKGLRKMASNGKGH